MEDSNNSSNIPQKIHRKKVLENASYSPVTLLWPRLSPQLRNALYGALCQHGIVSTRKAIAAIRGVETEVRTFLSRLDDIAPGAETVPATQDSTPKSAPNSLEELMASSSSETSFLCSSCVEAAAQSFLDDSSVEVEGSGNNDPSNIKIVDAKAFFVRLVRVSTGEFMYWWRKAGLTDDVVAAHLLRMSSALIEVDNSELTTRTQSEEYIDVGESTVFEEEYIMVD
mmetsp:Transcript_6046/g.13208  ORF Transcript_6046/g.13208 Transcript_6046/m.13208 type:complete len:226 (-) Transcript_6046:310-987(-)